MIIGEIRRYLRDNSAVRVSRSMRDTAYKVLQAKERFLAEHQREPTLDEIAAILTRVWGHPVTYVRETVEEAYESRKKWPAAQWEYDSWVSTYTSIARGEMDVVSTTVRDVTGRDPLTFEEVARAALASGH